MSSKNNDSSKTLWRPIIYSGIISEQNRAEINKSISYSIYFNFSDPTYTERQIRISSDSPYKLFMSPNFSAVPEFSGKIVNNNYVIEATPEAKANNAVNCAVEVTPEFLAYIPYHARNYITRWANSRVTRVRTFFQAGGSTINASTLAEQKTATFTPQPPLFDMNSASFPSTSKHTIMEKMAQVYYDLTNRSGEVPQYRIKKFLDVYNIGDTIFDARYIVSQKGNQQIRDQISTLTGQYTLARLQPMTKEELLELEQRYQSEAKALYAKEAANIIGNLTDCGMAARKVRISAVNPGSQIQLSQVLVYNNRGDNVALGLAPTFYSTINADLFGAGVTTQTPFYDYAGQQLMDLNDIAVRTARLNEAAGMRKLQLITDGAMTPRSAPNIYKSNWSTSADYLEFDFFGEQDVTSVQLVQPLGATAIPYNIILSDYNGTKFASTIASTQIADFRVKSDCPIGSLNRFRVARFYASTNSGVVRGTAPDPSSITFTGFSEDTSTEDCAALSFNPKYNGGFDIPIDQNSGNQNYEAKVQFTKNVIAMPDLNCANPSTLVQLIAEYSITQETDTFKSRTDSRGIVGTGAYTFGTHSFIPSSITGAVQVSPSTCGIAWNELKVNKSTNAYEALIQRVGTIVMRPDTENWLSPSRVYDVAASKIYADATAFNAETTKTIQALAAGPINLPIPLPVRAVLDNAGGACPEKRCSDLDVIQSLVAQYNAMSTAKTSQILRVNKATTVNASRCDYEVVMGDYSGGTGTTAVSTIALGTLIDSSIDPSNPCAFRLVSVLGSGSFVTPTTPLLTRIYTYAWDYVKQFTNLFSDANAELSTLAIAQAPISESTLKMYRGDSLAAYGAIKQLDGCQPADTTNRCTSPQILDQFIQRYRLLAPGRRLKRILRAGAASGTECDFTFETEDIGAAGTATNQMTRGLRCGMQLQSTLGCSFTVGAGPYQNKEAYVVTSTIGAVFTRQAAYNVCSRLGGQLATADQVARASTLGASWADAGWLADRLSTTSLTGTLVDGTAGAAICYGVKPDSAGTFGTLRPFNSSAAKQPFTATGPCMEMIPQPPTMADLADLGIRQTTASPDATVSSGMLLTTAPTVPYSLSDSAISPIDFINCGDRYALQSMGGLGSATSGPAYNQCQSGGQTYTFNRDPNSGMLVYNGVTPTLSLTLNPINSDIDCLLPEKVNLTGFGTTIRAVSTAAGTNTSAAAKRMNTNTCEYRLRARDDAPFGQTYRQISFYTDGTQNKLLSSVPASELTSPSTYKPSLTSVLGNSVQLSTLCGIAKATWNAKYDTVAATEAAPRQRFGDVSGSEIGYIPATDSLVIEASSADIGPLGNEDIRTYYGVDPRTVSNPKAYFIFTFRKPFGSTNMTDVANTTVHFMSRQLKKPQGITATASGLQRFVAVNSSGKSPGDSIVKPITTNLLATRSFRMLRFKNTSGATVELYRFNLVRGVTGSTFDATHIIRPSFATVSLTDKTGTPLLAPTISLPESGGCPPEYDLTVDPISKFNVCSLNYSKIPTDKQSLYRYTPVAGNICRLGYNLDTTTGECVLNYRLEDLLTSVFSSAPTNSSPRAYLENGQSLIIDLKDYVQIDGYVIAAGRSGRRPTQWQIEGSNNGTSWGTIATVTNYTFPSGFLPVSGYFPWGKSAPEASRAAGTLTSWIGQEPLEEFQNPPRMQPSVSVTPRRSWLRFRWVATADPNAKFVSMSVLRFYTESGVVPPAWMRITNLGGSRRSAAEGPDALLSESNTNRWVDYNRQPLIIRFDPMPAEPIVAFRFAFPAEPGAAPGAVPVRWILEGSFDGRSWTTVQDYRTESARMLALNSAYLRLQTPL